MTGSIITFQKFFMLPDKTINLR
ncbi:hypothetical protein THIARS_60224 [Thiomonas delicata]|uniref:Uncharacterized protein n=1 Tax=Thiomonas delicata TaxID=364030 RepID=A0A238D2N1_THIDL|nr:hypothetical protein THIARS_60224 [Thiomonas delicata]